MNKKQMVVMWVCVVVAVGMFLCPPQYTDQNHHFSKWGILGSAAHHVDAQVEFQMQVPAYDEPYYGIDYRLLFCEWALLAFVGFAAYKTVGNNERA